MIIFRVRTKSPEMKAVAVAFSITWQGEGAGPASGVVAGRREEALERLDAFRGELYRCLTKRGDPLFELADAVLWADGPVKVLAGLSLAAEHRRDRHHVGRHHLVNLTMGHRASFDPAPRPRQGRPRRNRPAAVRSQAPAVP